MNKTFALPARNNWVVRPRKKWVKPTKFVLYKVNMCLHWYYRTRINPCFKRFKLCQVFICHKINTLHCKQHIFFRIFKNGLNPVVFWRCWFCTFIPNRWVSLATSNFHFKLGVCAISYAICTKTVIIHTLGGDCTIIWIL
jgi:hypothetical protein